MRKITMLAAAAASLGALSLAHSASAGAVFASHVIGTEDNVAGFIGTVPSSAGAGDTITVASDGEATFTPFGITHDTSDAVSLTGGWNAAAGNQWENWGGGVWDLPACDAGGVCENGNVHEPTGLWTWVGATWTNGLNKYIIKEAGGGGLSDVIRTYNLPDGTAAFSFKSGVPEPATWAMMILGVAMIGFSARRRSAKSAPTA
jgi:hypothetical protein